MADQTIPTIKNLRGNIGIGTASPSYKLEVAGETLLDAPNGSTHSLRLGRADNANKWFFNHAGNDLRIYNAAGSGYDIMLGVNSGGTAQDNKVGIGTATPDHKLHIKGDRLRIEESVNARHLDIIPAVSGSSHIFTSSTTGSGYTFQNSSGTIAILDANGSAFYQDLTIASSNLKLSSAHYVQFGSANARIQGSNGSNYLKFYTAGVERLAITNTEATFSGDLVVTGGLTINGTTTTIDTTNLLVEDKNIIIGNVSSPSDTTADGGGITLKGASDYTINWLNSNDSWNFNQGIVVGEDDTGHDVKFFGATSGRFLRWVQSEDRLKLADNTKLSLGGGNDLSLWHSGSHSYINNDVGDLFIYNNTNDGNITFYSDDGSGGVTEYFRIDGGANQNVFPVSVLLNDGVYLHIGTGSDLQLYHDATNSNINNNTGDLHILNTADDKDILLRADDGSGGNATYIQLDGSVTRNKLLQHTSLPDGKNLILGAGDDLYLYHSGTHSYIENNTGNLYIRNNADDNDIIFESDDGSGGTTPYFRLDGDSGYTKAHKEIRMDDSIPLRIGTGGDARFMHDGSNTYLDNYTGDFYIRQATDDKDLIFQCDDGSGGVETYFFLDGSTGTTPYTIFPDSSRLTFGDSTDLQIFHDGNNSYISHVGSGSLTIRNKTEDTDIYFKCDDGSGGEETYFFLDGSKSTGDPYTIFPNNSFLGFGDSGNLLIRHTGLGASIQNNGGDIDITQNTNDGDIRFYCDDGSGGTAEYFRVDGGATLTYFSKSIRFADGIQSGFGADNDLVIYHNTSGDSVIDNFTGDLYISNKADDKDIVFRSDDGSGGYETYFYLDGSISSGNPFTVFPDNSYLSFGTNFDLRFTHDGSNSYISQTGTGSLYIQNFNDDKDIAFQCDDGSGSLETYFYLDGSLSSGNPFTIFPDNSRLGIGTSADLYFNHDGTHSFINSTNGNLYIVNYANDKDIILQSDDGSGGATAYITLDGSTATTVFSKPLDINTNVEIDGNFDLDGTFIRPANLTETFSLSNIATETTHALGTLTFGSVYTHAFRVTVMSYGGYKVFEYLGYQGNLNRKVWGSYNQHQQRFEDIDVVTEETLNGSGEITAVTIGVRNTSASHTDYIFSVKVECFSQGNHTWSDASPTDSITNNAVNESTIRPRQYFHGLTVGKDDTGHDVQFYGATSGRYMLWDESADALRLTDWTPLYLGTGNDFQLYHDGTNSNIINTNGDLTIQNSANDKDIIFQSDDGSGGVTTYFRLDGSFGGAGYPTTLFPQNSSLRFGNQGNLQIINDGTDSFIQENNGHLYIRNVADDKDIILQTDDGSGGLTAYLTLDGSAGYMWASKAIRFADNVNAQWGASADLVLRHNGTTSYIENYTGNLDIKQHADDSDIIFYSDDGSGGSAEYFRLDGGLGYSVASKQIRFNDSISAAFGSDNDFGIDHNGTDARIFNYTGDLYISNFANDKDIIFQSDDGSGGTETYFFLDGSLSSGNPYTIFPDNSYLIVGSDTHGISLHHDGSHSHIRNYTGDLRITNYADDSKITFYCDDGSGGHEIYFYLDGNLSSGSPFTVFPDNSKLTFGNGNDLILEHNGADSYISNYVGELYIRNDATDKDIIFQSDDGSGGMAQYIRIDGSAGLTQFDKDTKYVDTIKATFGNSSDLSIQHDGNNSYISENGTGDLFIDSNNASIYLRDSNSGNVMIAAKGGSSEKVELYFGGSKKFETSATGATMGGDLVMGGNDIKFADDGKVRLGDSNDLDLYHNGTNSYIQNDTGDFRIEQRADDGDMEFYCDNGSGGIAKYFHLDGGEQLIRVSCSNGMHFNDNVRIKVGSGTGGDLRIYHDGSSSIIANETGHLDIKNNANDADVRFFCDDGSNGLTEYFRLDGGDTYVVFSRHTRNLDTMISSFGNSDDLRISHNGTSSEINNYTGNLFIRNYANDSDIYFDCDDGSGGTETYFYLDGSLSGGSPYTVFPDDSILTFGSGGGDMTIHHDGTDSKIRNQTGDLYITQNTNDGDIILECDNGSGGVTTYLQLDGGGALTRSYRAFRVQDDVKLQAGSAGDLDIKHTSNNSYIENHTGHLYVTNTADDSDITFRTDDGSGGVTKYFQLDGGLADGTNLYTVFPDNSRIRFGDGLDLDIHHDGSNSYINQTGTGNLYIQQTVDGADMIFKNDDGSGALHEYMRLDGGMYHVVFSKSTQHADGAYGKFGNGGDLQLSHNGTNSFIKNTNGDLYIENSADDKDIIFKSDDGSGGTETYFFLDGSVSSGNPITKFPDNSILALGTSGDFYHYHDGTDSYHANFTGDFYIDNNANDKDVILRSDNGSGGLAAYITLDGSAGDIKFSKNVDASSQNIVAYYLEGTYKSFLIDHPTQEGKKLRHGCLEGPEHGVYFRGNSSDSIIECPEYWMGLVEEDSVTVQLTAIGPNQNIYVDHIDEDGNIHVGSNTDEPLNYYYTVNGERKGDKVVVVEDA